MDVVQVLEVLKAETGRPFRLLGPAGGGESGSTYVVSEGNRKWVLKIAGPEAADGWDARRSAVEELRARGYPAPAFEAIGSTDGSSWLIEEYLEGSPGSVALGVPVVQAVALNSLQADLRVPVAKSFWENVVGVAVRGGAGYCEVASLRAYSATTSELASDLLGILTEAGELPSGDAVHYDFSPANMLLSGGRISGVIDVEALLYGDRAFDLVTLLYYTRGVEAREHIRKTVLDLTSLAAARVYMAHIVLRQTDWSIRHHDDATVERWLSGAHENLRLFS